MLNQWKSTRKSRATQAQVCKTLFFSAKVAVVMLEFTSRIGKMSKVVENDAIGCEKHENMTESCPDIDHRTTWIGPKNCVMLCLVACA